MSLEGATQSASTRSTQAASSATPDPHHPPPPPTVCVFCGSSSGKSPAHLAAARELAYALHKHGIKLVYGGGTVGLMGELAKTLVALAGPDAVHGVIPEPVLKYEREGQKEAGIGQDGCARDSVYGRVTVVKDMHTRKQTMAREVIESGPGGGFIALSGGYGTMEELMEVVTWNQLGVHARGIVLYNVEGYYDGLLTWVKTAIQSGFVSPLNSDIMVEAKTAEQAIERLRDYTTTKGRYSMAWDEQ